MVDRNWEFKNTQTWQNTTCSNTKRQRGYKFNYGYTSECMKVLKMKTVIRRHQRTFLENWADAEFRT